MKMTEPWATLEDVARALADENEERAGEQNPSGRAAGDGAHRIEASRASEGQGR